MNLCLSELDLKKSLAIMQALIHDAEHKTAHVKAIRSPILAQTKPYGTEILRSTRVRSCVLQVVE